VRFASIVLSLVDVRRPILSHAEVYTSQAWNLTLVGGPIMVKYRVKQHAQQTFTRISSNNDSDTMLRSGL